MSAAQTIVELKHGKTQLTSAFLYALPEAILPAILDDIVSLLGLDPMHPFVLEEVRKTPRLAAFYILDMLNRHLDRLRVDVEILMRERARQIIERHLIEYYE